MNKVYLLAPLVGMLVFGPVYSKNAREHNDRLARTQELETATRMEKKAAEEAAKANAMEVARVAQARRSDERAEKERLEEMQKQARSALDERRNLAIAEAARRRPELAALQRERDVILANVERSEIRMHQLHREKLSLLERVQQAETNRRALDQLLERVDSLTPRRAASSSSTPNSKSPRG